MFKLKLNVFLEEVYLHFMASLRNSSGNESFLLHFTVWGGGKERFSVLFFFSFLCLLFFFFLTFH